jgi:ribosomal protein S18 acetylase RimI-like enzyme
VVQLGVELTTHRTAWAGVLGELRRSCRARADASELLDISGAVGVLSGASPVVWLHAPEALAEVARVLAESLDVSDVYAGEGLPLGELEACGWIPDLAVRQVVLDLPTTRGRDRYEDVCELGADDVPAFVAGLQRSHGLSDRVVAHAYPADFLERAAPVRLFGVRDGERLLGAVATRRPFVGALLFGLWVAPAERGRGIARALVTAAAQAERAAGARFLHAQVAGPSLDLTLSLGWQDCGGWQHLSRVATPNG